MIRFQADMREDGDPGRVATNKPEQRVMMANAIFRPTVSCRVPQKLANQDAPEGWAGEMVTVTTPGELMALVERLEDYGLTLDPGVIICDRRVIDEAIAALKSLAEKDRP